MGRRRSSLDVVRDWLDGLPEGTKIVSPKFKGDTFVKRGDYWTRGPGPVGPMVLLAYSMVWDVVS